LYHCAHFIDLCVCILALFDSFKMDLLNLCLTIHYPHFPLIDFIV
jgi:hypothetical protein